LLSEIYLFKDVDRPGEWILPNWKGEKGNQLNREISQDNLP